MSTLQLSPPPFTVTVRGFCICCEEVGERGVFHIKVVRQFTVKKYTGPFPFVPALVDKIIHLSLQKDVRLEPIPL